MEKDQRGNPDFKREWEFFNSKGKSYVGNLKILEDVTISCQGRVLFCIISSISFNKGYCFASNKTLSKKLGKSLTMVKAYLEELETKELIEIKYADGSLGTLRHIFINFIGLGDRYFSTSEKLDAPPEWRCKKEYNKRQKVTLEEVRAKMSRNT